MATERQTIEQERAAAAWIVVEQVSQDAQAKYGTFARRFPAMIQMNGLGSTLAFLLAKGKGDNSDGHQMLYNHISTWVCARLNANHTDLMQLVRDEDMRIYRRATMEAIEYGIWLKRYVEAKDWGSDTGDDT